MFSWREIKAADTSRELYQKTGRPDEAKFQTILQKNHIRNCPVTPADSQRALIIYGPDIAVVKGKTTQSNAAPHVPTFEAVPIPLPVLEHHRKITIYEDFFYVHRVQFFHSISRSIGFRTVKPVINCDKSTILQELEAVVKLYQHRGFHVCDIHADQEFACVHTDCTFD